MMSRKWEKPSTCAAIQIHLNVETASSHPLTIAHRIRLQATADIATFRARRLAAHRSDMDTRLVRVVVAARLQELLRASQEYENMRASLKEEHKSLITRLQDIHTQATGHPLREIHQSHPTPAAGTLTVQCGLVRISPKRTPL